jgi:large subunit ribosomal protein L4
LFDGVSNEILLSSRNIPGVELRVAPGVSVRDVLNADKIVMTRAAVAKLEEVFA